MHELPRRWLTGRRRGNLLCRTCDHISSAHEAHIPMRLMRPPFTGHQPGVTDQALDAHTRSVKGTTKIIKRSGCRRMTHLKGCRTPLADPVLMGYLPRSAANYRSAKTMRRDRRTGNFCNMTQSNGADHGAKNALITRITRQDGALLAEFLLQKGYVVHGIKRRSSSFNTGRVDHLYVDPHQEGARFFMHHGDLTDATNLIRIVQETQPTEIYNLAAQSHVQVSFETPEYTANADGIGTLRLLEALRILGMERRVRFYQASTSELYGLVRETPQRETTPFYPRSPYAAAKLYAFWITVNYREAYGMHASNGILFNHEG